MRIQQWWAVKASKVSPEKESLTCILIYIFINVYYIIHSSLFAIS